MPNADLNPMPSVDHYGDAVPRTTGGDVCDRELVEPERVVVTTGLTFEQFMRATKAVARCPQCHKSLIVANVAPRYRPFEGEPISTRTHCACPGGPAHHLLATRESA